jgi:hypothetical protein
VQLIAPEPSLFSLRGPRLAVIIIRVSGVRVPPPASLIFLQTASFGIFGFGVIFKLCVNCASNRIG